MSLCLCILTKLSAVSPVCFSAFVKLCFDYGCNPTDTHSHPLSLFHQIATAWANVPVTALPWDRRWLHCECEEKREERDCFQIAQAPKKRHFFHFLPGLQEKKKKSRRRQRLPRKGMGGNCWAQCKEVNLFSLGNLPEGLGWSLKSFSKKILN